MDSHEAGISTKDCHGNTLNKNSKQYALYSISILMYCFKFQGHNEHADD